MPLAILSGDRYLAAIPLPGTCPLTECPLTESSLDEQRAKTNPTTTNKAKTALAIYRYLRLRILLHLLVLGDAYVAEIAYRHYHGDILVGLGMTYTGCKEQLIAFGLVEHKALENTGLAIVIIETTIKGTLGERLGTEDTAIGADNTQCDAVVDKLLAGLGLD